MSKKSERKKKRDDQEWSGDEDIRQEAELAEPEGEGSEAQVEAS